MYLPLQNNHPHLTCMIQSPNYIQFTFKHVTELSSKGSNPVIWWCFEYIFLSYYSSKKWCQEWANFLTRLTTAFGSRMTRSSVSPSSGSAENIKANQISFIFFFYCEELFEISGNFIVKANFLFLYLKFSICLQLCLNQLHGKVDMQKFLNTCFPQQI